MSIYSKTNPGRGYTRVSPGVYERASNMPIPQRAGPHRVNKIFPNGLSYGGVQSNEPTQSAPIEPQNRALGQPMPGRLASFLPNAHLGGSIPYPWGAQLYGGGFENNPYAQILLETGSQNDSWGMPYPTQRTRPLIAQDAMQSMVGGVKP